MNDEDPIEQILKKAAELEKIVNAPSRPLSPRLQQFAAEMAQNPSVIRDADEATPAPAEQQASIVVNKSQMRLWILKRLAKPMDSISLVQQFREEKVELRTTFGAAIHRMLRKAAQKKSRFAKWCTFILEIFDVHAKATLPGEAALYGILRNMERAGLLEGKWTEVSNKMTKSYKVTPKGSALLAAHTNEVADVASAVLRRSN